MLKWAKENGAMIAVVLVVALIVGMLIFGPNRAHNMRIESMRAVPASAAYSPGAVIAHLIPGSTQVIYSGALHDKAVFTNRTYGHGGTAVQTFVSVGGSVIYYGLRMTVQSVEGDVATIAVEIVEGS